MKQYEPMSSEVEELSASDIKGGPIYDTENGDSPPENFYNGEGMYLGDGVWVSMDFFD